MVQFFLICWKAVNYLSLFRSGFSGVMQDIDINKDDQLDTVMRKVSMIKKGATDCSLPMLDAMERKIRDIDVFVIYTDNITWLALSHI